MTLFINIIFPLLLVIFVIISIKFLINYLNHKKILDIPNERSNHRKPIPKGAGIIIIPLLTIAILFYSILGLVSFQPWGCMVLIMLFVCGFSFYDDLVTLSSYKKLVLQSLAVFVGIVLFFREISNFVFDFSNNSAIYVNFNFLRIILILLISIFWLWVMNLFNFMDGIDGITSVQVIFFSMGLIIFSVLGEIAEDLKYVGIIIYSVFLGFLYWNITPSKIFIGDSGSISIGFLIGGILIFEFLIKENFVPLFLIILYYMSDTSLTLIKRIYKKNDIFAAHSEHYYQKKIRNGSSHRYVLKYIIYLNSTLLFFSVLSLSFGIFSIVSSILAVLFFILWLNKKKDGSIL